MLVETFNEKPTQEFLLTETEDLVDELLLEFGEWIEKSQIGEKTHEGRQLELVKFKSQSATDKRESAVLFDGAHHSRELVTIKMTLTILLKLLHGVHHGDS